MSEDSSLAVIGVIYSSFGGWAPLSLWHRPPLKFRRGLGAPLSLQGASSGGSLWGGCSLYLLFGGSCFSWGCSTLVVTGFS